MHPASGPTAGMRVARAMTAALLCQSAIAGAAQWFVEPSMAFGAENHSNITLTTEPHEDVNALRLTPTLRLGSQSEYASTDVSASTDILRYPGTDQLDAENINFGTTTRYNRGRYGYRGSAAYARNTLLDTTLILGADIGPAQTAVLSTLRSLSGGFNWYLSPVALADFNLAYSTAHYTDDLFQQYFDYRYYVPQASLTWIIAERLRVFASASYANISYPDLNPRSLPPGAISISVPDTKSESRTTSGQLGMTYDLTPQMDFTASVGRRRSRSDSVRYQVVGTFFGILLFDNVASETESSGAVFDLAYAWRMNNRTRLDVSVRQDITPSGQSAGLLATTFSSVFAHDLTERLNLGIVLDRNRYRSDEGTLNFVNNVDRDYYRGEARASYRLSETWRIFGGYIRAHQQYTSNPQDASGDMVALTLSWNPPRRYLSR